MSPLCITRPETVTVRYWTEVLQSLSLVLHTKLQTPSVNCTPGQGRCLYIKGNFTPTRNLTLVLSKAQKLRGMLTTAFKMRPDFKRYPQQLKCKFCQKSRTVPTIITWLLNSDWYTHKKNFKISRLFLWINSLHFRDTSCCKQFSLPCILNLSNRWSEKHW